MFRYALVLLWLVGLPHATAGQEAAPVAPAAPPASRIHVKSPYIAAYQAGADVDVKAFLFRYVAPGFKPMLGPSHPRYVHVLVVTNVESATCETAFFHWDEKTARLGRSGAVLDLQVNDESKFLLLYAAHFPDEPEYLNMGEDFFAMSATGGIYREKAEYPKGSAGEQAAIDFTKLGRKEKFAVLSRLLAPIWPFRPYTMYVTARTARGDKKTVSRISPIRPPNFVSLSSEVDKLVVEGEVPVITCK
ncbi:MAG: hypothetical protein LAO06_12545 [Acidobacteriia bacterium]|nr:hypothetical protein [Terriglobia bacterium]